MDGYVIEGWTLSARDGVCQLRDQSERVVLRVSSPDESSSQLLIRMIGVLISTTDLGDDVGEWADRNLDFLMSIRS